MAGNLPFEAGTMLYPGLAAYGKVRPTPALYWQPSNGKHIV
jgi:hypothetical protein